MWTFLDRIYRKALRESTDSDKISKGESVNQKVMRNNTVSKVSILTYLLTQQLHSGKLDNITRNGTNH